MNSFFIASSRALGRRRIDFDAIWGDWMLAVLELIKGRENRVFHGKNNPSALGKQERIEGYRAYRSKTIVRPILPWSLSWRSRGRSR